MSENIVELATFREFLGSERAAAATVDSLALSAAEAWVNSYCQRQFIVASTATTRTFRPSGSGTVDVGDFTELSSVTADGTAIDLDDVEAGGASISITGEALPYTSVRYITGGVWWPQWTGPRYSIEVTAKWGWAEIPAPVQMATLICAKDIAKSRDISFGIAGFTEYAGVRAKPNDQVAALLAPYRRAGSWGIA